MPERYATLPLTQIEPDPLQPRVEMESVNDSTVTEARTLQGLAQSIREFGVLQPIRVRRLPDTPEARYCIVSGQRRFEAARLAGLEALPVLIEDEHESSEDRLLRQVTENLQRKALTATELALAISTLLQSGASRELVQQRLGVPSSQVTILLSLLKLNEPVKVAFARGRIESPRAAYDLNRLPRAVQEAVIAEADSQGRVIAQTDVRDARQALKTARPAGVARFEGPPLAPAEYGALQAALHDGVHEAYAPAPDRDAVFGQDWRKAVSARKGAKGGEGTAGVLTKVSLPSLQLSREQVLRLLNGLCASGLVTEKARDECQTLTQPDALAQRLSEILQRI